MARLPVRFLLSATVALLCVLDAAPASAQAVDPAVGLDALETQAEASSDSQLMTDVARWEAALTEAIATAAAAGDAAADEPADQTELKDAEKAADQQVTALAKRLLVLVDEADGRELDVSGTRALLLEVLGLQAAGTDLDAFGELLQSWLARGQAWLEDDAPALLVRLLGALLLLFVFRVLASVAAGLMRRTLDHSKLKVSPLLKKFFVGLAQKFVFLFGVMLALSSLGIELGPLLAGVGIVGFVVGFALQDTLANFAAGIMILLYRPFDVGDFVDVAGESGEVIDLNLVSTKLRTLDNQIIILPNGSVWGGTIKNRTAQPTRRCDVTIGISYSDDIDKAMKVFHEVVAAHPMTLKDPQFDIVMAGLGDSSVNLTVRPWVKTSNFLPMRSDLTRQLKYACDENGLSIPFPQRDVHVYKTGED